MSQRRIPYADWMDVSLLIRWRWLGIGEDGRMVQAKKILVKGNAGPKGVYWAVTWAGELGIYPMPSAESLKELHAGITSWELYSRKLSLATLWRTGGVLVRVVRKGGERRWGPKMEYARILFNCSQWARKFRDKQHASSFQRSSGTLL